MQRIGKAIATAALLAAASSAGAADVPTALERVERHYLCRTQGCFDPLSTYANTAPGNWTFATKSWTSPDGVSCEHYWSGSGCAILTANKAALKAALKMTIDEELGYLIGNRMIPAYGSSIPFVIKAVDVTETTVVLYGGDRKLDIWPYKASSGVDIYP